MITKFKEFILEQIDSKSLKDNDMDAIPFAMYNNKWYTGEKGSGHGENLTIKATIDYMKSGKTGDRPDKLKYRGRIWENSKILKFSDNIIPNKELFKDIQEILNKDYPEDKINLNEYEVLTLQNKLINIKDLEAKEEVPTVAGKIKYGVKPEGMSDLAWDKARYTGDSKVHNFEQFLNEKYNL